MSSIVSLPIDELHHFSGGHPCGRQTPEVRGVFICGKKSPLRMGKSMEKQPEINFWPIHKPKSS
jgi:hypothetical protein